MAPYWVPAILDVVRAEPGCDGSVMPSAKAPLPGSVQHRLVSLMEESMISAGMIICWGGQKNNIPPGWHECDGTLLSQTQYANLYAAIGESFGQSPPAGQFYLPDLRGQFVRGVDDGAGNDPDLSARHDMQNPSITYSGVGSVQASALQTHTHAYSTIVEVSSNGIIDDAHAYGYASWASAAPAGCNVSQSETRSTNAALYYIINLGTAA
jgi:rhizosphere induced protein